MRYRTLTTMVLIVLAGGAALGLQSGNSSENKPRASLSPLPDSRYFEALKTAEPFRAAGLPTYYDLRAVGKMTPVRNEGILGGSPAFAVLASLESFLKPLENWDFSENHLRTTTGNAGSLDILIGALAGWSDPVREADSPWPASRREDIAAVKHVQNVQVLPPRTGSLDNDRIKQTVLDTGAVFAPMVYTESLFNPAQSSFYNSGTPGETRAVVIAGWDDNFDRSRFSPQPPGNGAFLCKNSRGTEWGSGGYFYVSYHDVFFCRTALPASFTTEPRSGSTVNYQYDPNGCTIRMGFEDEAAWFANIFNSSSADPLVAVSFYTYAPSSDYEILIYKDSTPGRPRSGTLARRLTGSLTAAGYVTVPLDAPVPLFLNQRFSAVVKLRTAGDFFPIPIEHPVSGLTAIFTANPDQSFVSADGVNWNDLVSYDGTKYAKTNVCLKAFAGYAPFHPPAEFKVERLVNNLFFFKEYVDKLSWQLNPRNTQPPAHYRIYRKFEAAAETDFRLLDKVGPSPFFYFVRAVNKDEAFVYRITAVLADGRESDPAEFSI